MLQFFMSLFTWIIFGALAGWLSTKFTNTYKRGFLNSMVLGIIGSIAGGFIMSFLNKPGVTGFNLYSIFVAVIGAMSLIIIARLFGDG